MKEEWGEGGPHSRAIYLHIVVQGAFLITLRYPHEGGFPSKNIGMP